MYKCGFFKVVLGLSGGIDLVLVVVIVIVVLGKENVLVILMFFFYSFDYFVKDVLELVENLGIVK